MSSTALSLPVLCCGAVAAGALLALALAPAPAQLHQHSTVQLKPPGTAVAPRGPAVRLPRGETHQPPVGPPLRPATAGLRPTTSLVGHLVTDLAVTFLAGACGLLLVQYLLPRRSSTALSVAMFSSIGVSASLADKVMDPPSANQRQRPWDPLNLFGPKPLPAALTHDIEQTYLPVFAGLWLLMLPFVLWCELENVQRGLPPAASPIMKPMMQPVQQRLRWDPLGLAADWNNDAATPIDAQHGRVVLLGALAVAMGGHAHHLVGVYMAPAALEALYLPIFAGFWAGLIPLLVLCEWPAIEAMEQETPAILHKVRIPIDTEHRLHH